MRRTGTTDTSFRPIPHRPVNPLGTYLLGIDHLYDDQHSTTQFRPLPSLMSLHDHSICFQDDCYDDEWTYENVVRHITFILSVYLNEVCLVTPDETSQIKHIKVLRSLSHLRNVFVENDAMMDTLEHVIADLIDHIENANDHLVDYLCVTLSAM